MLPLYNPPVPMSWSAQGPYTNTYGTSTRSLGSYTSNAQSTPYTAGVLNLLAAATAVDVNTLRVAYENLRVFAENAVQQHNALVADLKTLGLLN